MELSLRRIEAKIMPGRYLRAILFFGSMALAIIWWEIILKAVLGEKAVGRGRSARLSSYAHRFKRMAVKMGGVMIKVGQFVGSRTDVLPPAIISELADLLDEVPPEPLAPMLAVFEKELGAKPADLFASFEDKVMASASLGQVYPARTKEGARVAVKIQRPDIDRIVATDLKTLEIVAGWLMLWKVIRKRADVPALTREFADTLWLEMDYESEASNAERFAELFADNPFIYIPRIYREFTTRRVITLEDVTAIKVTETDKLDAAGIDRPFVARQLIDAYLKMIFEYRFFHADPHPGNLFIYPLPDDANPDFLKLQAGRPGKPFYIVLIDFGMAGTIGPQTQEGLHEFMLGIATRDAKRMLHAYQILDVLLPNADLSAIQAMDTDFMEMIYGRSIPELMKIKEEEARALAVKYVDLIHDMPFQMPQNFIYLARAISILSGISIQLDPAFNPWKLITEYATRFIGGTEKNVVEIVLSEVKTIGRKLLALPGQISGTLGDLDAGKTQVQVEPNPMLASDIRRLGRSVKRLESAVLTVGLGAIGAIFYTGAYEMVGWVFFGAAGLIFAASLIDRIRPPGHGR